MACALTAEVSPDSSDLRYLLLLTGLQIYPLNNKAPIGIAPVDLSRDYSICNACDFGIQNPDVQFTVVATTTHRVNSVRRMRVSNGHAAKSARLVNVLSYEFLIELEPDILRRSSPGSRQDANQNENWICQGFLSLRNSITIMLTAHFQVASCCLNSSSSKNASKSFSSDDTLVGSFGSQTRRSREIIRGSRWS